MGRILLERGAVELAPRALIRCECGGQYGLLPEYWQYKLFGTIIAWICGSCSKVIWTPASFAPTVEGVAPWNRPNMFRRIG